MFRKTEVPLKCDRNNGTVLEDQYTFLFISSSLTMSKEWTTTDFLNKLSTTNLEEEEIVDAPGNDGNASMPKQVKRPNPWRKKKKMMMMMMI